MMPCAALSGHLLGKIEEDEGGQGAGKWAMWAEGADDAEKADGAEEIVLAKEAEGAKGAEGQHHTLRLSGLQLFLIVCLREPATLSPFRLHQAPSSPSDPSAPAILQTQ